jgi:hypothetical protein
VKIRFALPDSPAFTFVLTMGIVNLFVDTTYEGGASINGPFLASLGASAAIVSPPIQWLPRMVWIDPVSVSMNETRSALSWSLS